MIVVAPDQFGLTGQTLAQVEADATDVQIREALATGLRKHKPVTTDSEQHIAEGRRQGVTWETAIPVTDPQALQNEPGPRPRRKPR